MRHGTAFVWEDVDDTDPDICAGRWSTYWEGGGAHLQGPQGVSAQQAIAWAREHADVVLVMPADSDVHYSAGQRRPEPEGWGSWDFPPWPEGQELPRRRASGMEYLDRTHDAVPIAWRIEGGGMGPLTDPMSFAASYAQALRADDAVVDVLATALVGGAGRYECEFTVLAATIDEADDIARGVTDRAVEAAVAATLGRQFESLRSVLQMFRLDTFIKRPVPFEEQE
jgi:hypothetical protein